MKLRGKQGTAGPSVYTGKENIGDGGVFYTSSVPTLHFFINVFDSKIGVVMSEDNLENSLFFLYSSIAKLSNCYIVLFFKPTI
ncbi:MAG: hypothetical protein COX80_02650 [Candidatus Magasanikbacteria bacterium CG_4_10_14_0_2_um_filter_33_14]|uniref:Uncharacterized protein n=1 Tax=Candidatus Magasanikbacteria bacterium CG_4_10_14_0_2_um_filter_33_14 TaxID=1974636 RepID=A0A2M7VAS4_9BACT|nr:MAG: hypothetical protein COX80_02650 [Candidatus Magasanikbacteria bacterium CG_4_10_14_0_2_um_filter_33_14]